MGRSSQNHNQTTIARGHQQGHSALQYSVYVSFARIIFLAIILFVACLQIYFLSELDKLSEIGGNVFNNNNNNDNDDDHFKKEIVQIFHDNHIPCENQTLSSSPEEESSKVDIVMPWVNYTFGYFESHQTPFDFGEPIKRLYENVGLKRSPFTEICYTIRSILYNDVNNNIGNIYIVYNGHRHEGPTSCGFSKQHFPQVHFMPQQIFLKDVPTLNHPNMSSPRPHAVFPYIHRIPNLRPYFIFVMDDIFLLKPFNLGMFYDFKQNTIRSHLTGGLSSPGAKESIIALKKYFLNQNNSNHYKNFHPKNLGQLTTDGLHVPYLVQRCRVQEVEEIFSTTWACNGPAFHLCDYPNFHFHSMVQNYQLLTGSAKNDRKTNGFTELHSGAHSSKEVVKRRLESLSSNSSTISWIDIQGDGISDEHIPQDIEKKPQTEIRMLQVREAFDEWLQKQPFFSL